MARKSLTRNGFVFAFISMCAVTPAMAQTPDAAKPPKAAAKAAASAATGAAAGEGGLKSRVESLEEQLVDMQVVVGTLESLAKSGSSSASQVYRASPVGGADASRVEGLEAQVKALSAQLQQLSDQVRSQGGVPRRSEAPLPNAGPNAGTATAANTSPSTDDATAYSSGPPIPTAGGDAIGGIIGGDPAVGAQPATGALGATPSPVATAALPPAGDGSDPKQLYETAYGYLLQRDYGAAEVAFDGFLKKFPSDSLSGNAQYWLGESHFVRGQYKAAAGAFLKGYQAYAQSQKAPDSLLKLAMSLDRLGQKDAACSSFSELNTKFPNAPQNVKARALSERQRVGCP